ncbi:MAG: hypothetical protein R2713_18365 [Ilumatobacteraceae bacterium]
MRIYSATELKAKLRTAARGRRQSAPALHSPYWWLKCAVRSAAPTVRSSTGSSGLLEWEIVNQPAGMRVVEQVLALCFRQEHHRVRAQSRSQRPQGCCVTSVPDLPGVLSADEVIESAAAIARLQVDTGMIPWFVGGHCDPWNHVETAMALDVAGFHVEAEQAYEWLVTTQRADGSWWNYYLPDGSVEEAKLDTNVCAYVATGVWHHWLCTWDRAFVDHLWPTVERALDWVPACARRTGSPSGPARSTQCRGRTHCSPDRPASNTPSAAGPAWRTDQRATTRLGRGRRPHGPPRRQPSRVLRAEGAVGDGLVLPGARRRDDGRAREGTPRRQVGRVRDGGQGHPVCERRAVDHRVRRPRRRRCAFAVTGDLATATDLLAWTRSHRLDDGSYWTGIVYPSLERFPFGETSAYTAAAVILAAGCDHGHLPGERRVRPPRPH